MRTSVQFFTGEFGGNAQELGSFGQFPEEFLATEEALLNFCEETDHPGFLGFWEAQEHFVVLGYGKPLAAEVYEEECARLGIPILRRASGGGTVLQGPGCLNYTLVLPIEAREELGSITGANRYIMELTRRALIPLVNGELKVEGHTDLTCDGLKFSGNAQRRKRRCLLFHGSFLLNFDLDLISQTLRLPQQQPEYRGNRPHHKFISNLSVARSDLINALRKAWHAEEITDRATTNVVLAEARALVENKYSLPEWNRRT